MGDTSVVPSLADKLIQDFIDKFPVRFLGISELEKEWMIKKTIHALWLAKIEAANEIREIHPIAEWGTNGTKTKI